GPNLVRLTDSRVVERYTHWLERPELPHGGVRVRVPPRLLFEFAQYRNCPKHLAKLTILFAIPNTLATRYDLPRFLAADSCRSCTQWRSVGLSISWDGG